MVRKEVGLSPQMFLHSYTNLMLQICYKPALSGMTCSHKKESIYCNCFLYKYLLLNYQNPHL